jgi:hypothetical protein
MLLVLLPGAADVVQRHRDALPGIRPVEVAGLDLVHRADHTDLVLVRQALQGDHRFDAVGVHVHHPLVGLAKQPPAAGPQQQGHDGGGNQYP